MKRCAWSGAPFYAAHCRRAVLGTSASPHYRLNKEDGNGHIRRLGASGHWHCVAQLTSCIVATHQLYLVRVTPRIARRSPPSAGDLDQGFLAEPLNNFCRMAASLRRIATSILTTTVNGSGCSIHSCSATRMNGRLQPRLATRNAGHSILGRCAPPSGNAYAGGEFPRRRTRRKPTTFREGS